MEFYDTTRRAPRPPRSMPPPPLITSQSRSRTDRVEKDGNFLDRWSPKVDSDHYSRVRLHRQRKDSVVRNRRRQGLRHSDFLKARITDSDDVRSVSSFGSDCTSLVSPASSVAFSDLGSTFQTELDNYDDQIKSLQQGEWPVPPTPRARALRIQGKDFSMQKAKAMKSWALAESLMYGGNSASLRDSDSIHPSTSYQVGVIFSAPHHTASSEDTRWVSTTDPYNTATPFGIVHSKYRKMIVVKAFGEHCICVPIYSHNCRGLEGKEFLSEYVSIRNVTDQKHEAPEGPHVRLLAVGNDQFQGRIVSGKSSVKLTEFYSHRYDAPATIEGKLEEDTSLSKKRLLKLTA
ncbi:hypothetical protein F5Y03DRAFT_400418 [Xylaria venustula]|nr:hypothetical protein F5Y03DRAFT_400418 [Xylaria venustula]